MIASKARLPTTITSAGPRLKRFAFCLAASLPAMADAQMRTDGSVGVAQTLTGPNVLIPQSLGRLAGDNLFHSFTEFNVGRGESATFSTSSAGIANVISRVTGGSPSSINGRIALAAVSGAPAFWLINPAGVTFGAGAVLDVPGAFHVSTADSLKFPDGVFHADANRASTFSTARPEAFGFLGTTRASVRVAGATLGSGDAPFSVVAGDISVDAGSIANRGGDLRIVAVGGARAEVALRGPIGPAGGQLSLLNGATIQTTTASAVDSGAIRVAAGSARIEGKGGIITEALNGSIGNAGNIELSIRDDATLLSGGRVRSDTNARGNAGPVNVAAASVTIDRQGDGGITGIASQAAKGSTGNAGNVVVSADLLTIASGGSISSDTNAYGDGGSVKVDASRIFVDGKGLRTGISSDTIDNGNAGTVEIVARQSLDLLNGGAISSTTFGPGHAGSVLITAPSLTIDQQGGSKFTGVASQAGRTSSGNAGSVRIAADRLTVAKGGMINSDTYASGAGGSVKIDADRVIVDGSGYVAWISSDTSGRGNAGGVEIVARQGVELLDGGMISSTTYAAGRAGAVSVIAPLVTIDKRGGAWPTLITSKASSFSAGNAGNVVVVADLLTIARGGSINSSTFASGDAGSVKVAAGRVVIDGKGFRTRISSDTYGRGNAGAVEIVAGQGVELFDGGTISSNTRNVGRAGSISVAAPSVTIDRKGGRQPTEISSQAEKNSTGNAGSVTVAADLLTVVNGGWISADTSGSGDAGSVKVVAGRVFVDGEGFGAGVSSTTFGDGHAGNVEVSATTDMSVRDGGIVSSSTAGSGSAGAVKVTAGALVVDGSDKAASIDAKAWAGSSGQTGNVTINAREGLTLANRGALSIENEATAADPGRLVPTRLVVSAPSIELRSQGRISAASTGNVAASVLDIRFSDRLTLDSSSIATSANRGNGGAISIRGAGTMALTRSTVTTSVAGQSGNGGNIDVEAGGLALNTGFVQANTAAANASGGDVAIDVRLLVPSGNSLFVGGSMPYEFQPERFGFNVIQAAAPTGLSGTIQITSPSLDIAGSLGGLEVRTIDSGGLGRNPCQTSAGSSLAPGGRGGLPPSAHETLTIEAAAPVRVAANLPLPVLAQAEPGCRP